MGCRINRATGTTFSLEFVNVGGNDDLILSYGATPEPGTTMLVLAGVMPILAPSTAARLGHLTQAVRSKQGSRRQLPWSRRRIEYFGGDPSDGPALARASSSGWSG